MRTDTQQKPTLSRRTLQIDDTTLYLQHPDSISERDVYVDYAGLMPLVMDAVRESVETEPPLPVCLRSGPGTGKNELARAVARMLNKPSFTTQGSTDCAAQDLVVFPVPADGSRFDAVASGLCTACIEGGLALFDEIGKVARYAPEALTPLASLLDDRRVLWSDFLKRPFAASPGFAFICTTQSNEILPDYVTSRMLTFDIPPPDREAMMEILKVRMPATPDVLLDAFRDWASVRTDLTPRDGVLILHFAARRMRAEPGKALRPAEAASLVRDVASIVMAGHASHAEARGAKR